MEQPISKKILGDLDSDDEIVKEYLKRVQIHGQNSNNKNLDTNNLIDYVYDNTNSVRKAYIIGNYKYNNQKGYEDLQGVHHEVEKFDQMPGKICLSTLLKKMGFEVKQYTNQTQDQFTKLRKKIKLDIAQSEYDDEKINILVAYLGHGVSVEGGNDLFAVTSDIKLYSLEFISQLAQQYENCLIMSLLDCCRRAVSKNDFVNMGGDQNQVYRNNPQDILNLNYVLIKAQVNQYALDFKGITETFKENVLKGGNKELTYLIIDMQKEDNNIVYEGKFCQFKFFEQKIIQQQQQLQQFNPNQQFKYIRVDSKDQLEEVYSKLGEIEQIQSSILLASFHLYYLYMKKNIEKQDIKKIQSVVGTLKNIQELYLDLNNNDLGLDGAIMVSNAIMHLTQLTTLALYLKDNNLGLDGARMVSNAIMHLTQLTTLALYLNKNNLGLDGAIMVSNAILHLTQLKTLRLDLIDNNLGLDGARMVSNAIMHLTQLTTLALYLNGNNLGLEGARMVSNAMLPLTQLTTLELGFSNTGLNEQEKTYIENFCKQIIKVNGKKYIQLNELDV